MTTIQYFFVHIAAGLVILGGWYLAHTDWYGKQIKRRR